MRCESRTRDICWLTPDLLSELVAIAKTTGGCIIEVKDEQEMRGVAAYIFKKGDIDFNGHTKHCNTISLSNRIDVEQFRGELRPELNFGEIARDQIYHFVVHHETGHVLLDPYAIEMEL